MDDLKLFSGTANPELSRRIAEKLGVDVGDMTITRFSDGEVHAQVNQSARGDDVFIVQDLPDFTYSPVKGSFNKTLCSSCGEYVFDRYVRMKDGQPVCIPCSGYDAPPQRR